MRVHYYARAPNFGDGMNTWLWERLLPGFWDPGDGIAFCGIGTIINDSMPPARRWIVFTSGVGYGAPPAAFGRRGWHVVSVRGPLSAAVLELPPQTAVSDGALLIATLPEYAPLAAAERDGVVFVPHHHGDRAADWPEVCRRAGVEYLSPRLDGRHVIERLRRARLVLAEAMHAAIVADTLRVPWIPLVTSPQVSTFKWLDWTRAMGLPYAPIRVPASSASWAIRSLMLWAYDEAHNSRRTSDSAALAHFRRRYRRTAHPRREWLMEIGRRQHGRADALLKGPRLGERVRRFDERRLDKAAAALAAAAEQPGLLSDERTFSERLDALVERLEQVRSIAARARASYHVPCPAPAPDLLLDGNHKALPEMDIRKGHQVGVA